MGVGEGVWRERGFACLVLAEEEYEGGRINFRWGIITGDPILMVSQESWRTDKWIWGSLLNNSDMTPVETTVTPEDRETTKA